MNDLYLSVKHMILFRNIKKALKFAGTENFVIINEFQVSLRYIKQINEKFKDNNYRVKNNKLKNLNQIKFHLKYRHLKFKDDKSFILIKNEFKRWEIMELNKYKSKIGGNLNKGIVKAKKKKKKKKKDILELLDYI